MKIKRAGILLLACVLLVGNTLFFPVYAQTDDVSDGTVYYVDAQNGNDANSGTSTSSAWQSLDKVNHTVFEPGDSILLKRGGNWVGQSLQISCSGTKERPITFGCYGDDAAPLPYIECAFTEDMEDLPAADAVVYLKNVSYVTVENLALKNNTTNAGEQYNVKVEISDNYTSEGICIRGCTIVGSNPDKWSSWTHAQQDGIVVSSSKTNGQLGGIVIEDNHISNCKGVGIMVNGVYSGCDANGVINQKSGRNVEIRNNYLYNIGQDGIMVNNCVRPLVEHNIVNRSHSYSTSAHVAIWAFSCYNAVFRYNEAFNTQTTSDGQGYDCDYQCYYTTFEYNYSHDNQGGFMLICTEPKNWDGKEAFNVGSIVRYNISENDRKNTFSLTGHIKDTKIYNNTIYSGWENSCSSLFFIYSKDGRYGTNTAIINNIFYCERGGITLKNLTGTTFSNNLTYGTATGGAPKNDAEQTEDDGITASGNIRSKDPMFVDPGNGGTGIESCDAYALFDNSPALKAGQIIDDDLTTDFFGNPIDKSTPPNIGAYNGDGVPFVDDTPIYLDRFKMATDWENGEVGQTNEKIPNVLCGDTTKWLSTVYCHDDASKLAYGTGSTKGLRIHNDKTATSNTALHANIPAEYFLNTHGIRFYVDTNGKNVSGTVTFNGANMRYSIRYTPDQNWYYIHWDENFYDTKEYKTIKGSDERLQQTYNLLFHFSLPAGADLYFDDILLDYSFDPFTEPPREEIDVPITSSAPISPILFGDANDDQKVNGKDVLLIRQYLVGIVRADQFNLSNADVTGDQMVSGKDVLCIRQYLAGIITTFPNTDSLT